MHEFSLIQNLLELAKEKVQEVKGGKVKGITLRVGTLSGAEPELLKSAFQFLKEGTYAENAELKVIVERAKVQCHKCKTTFTPEDLDLTCPSCGNWGGKVLSGDEIYLEKLEVEVPYKLHG